MLLHAFRSGAWVAVTVVAVTLVPSGVAAQVDVGRRALEEADFQRAVRAFDRAERGEHLDRQELTALFEGRAMARFALGDETGARGDLRALGSLDPEHRFPAEAPPELGAMLAELVRAAGGGLAFALRWSEVTGGSALSVEVQRDAASLVRSVRIHTRVGVRGRWRTEQARSVVVSHPPGVRVYFHVDAIGPGGAVLLELGTRERPLLGGTHEAEAQETTSTTAVPIAPEVVVGAPPVAGPSAEPVLEPVAPREDADLPLIVGLSVGGGVLVVAAVIVGAVLGTQGGSLVTQPSAPFVVGF
ncbi:MAG: hypothetical protein OHK0013_30920 [Sandaracinaceae bacterium]